MSENDGPTTEELQAESRRLSQLIEEAERIRREIDEHLSKLHRAPNPRKKLS